MTENLITEFFYLKISTLLSSFMQSFTTFLISTQIWTGSFSVPILRMPFQSVSWIESDLNLTPFLKNTHCISMNVLRMKNAIHDEVYKWKKHIMNWRKFEKKKKTEWVIDVWLLERICKKKYTKKKHESRTGKREEEFSLSLSNLI